MAWDCRKTFAANKERTSGQDLLYLMLYSSKEQVRECAVDKTVLIIETLITAISFATAHN